MGPSGTPRISPIWAVYTLLYNRTTTLAGRLMDRAGLQPSQLQCLAPVFWECTGGRGWSQRECLRGLAVAAASVLVGEFSPQCVWL